MILLADSEGSDQTAWLRRLIWAFAIRILQGFFVTVWPKHLGMLHEAF